MNEIVTDSREQLVAAIGAALRTVLGASLPEITEDVKLFDELGLDSTGVFELLLLLEETISVEFDTDNLEMAHFATVRSLADLIQSEMGR